MQTSSNKRAFTKEIIPVIHIKGQNRFIRERRQAVSAVTQDVLVLIEATGLHTQTLNFENAQELSCKVVRYTNRGYQLTKNDGIRSSGDNYRQPPVVINFFTHVD